MRGPRAGGLSSDSFEPEPTSGRLLLALSSPMGLFVTVVLTFSVLGGLLQVVGSARGPLARPLTIAVAVHVAGNLVASTIAILLVLAARRRDAQHRRVSVRAAALGGAIGGAARLPLELLAGAELAVRDAAGSVLTEAGWFLIAALATNTVTRLARNERATRDELAEALQLQTVLRTQMLEADLKTRRDVAEWLHGSLQAELILAADQLRRAGPAGEVVADRLTRLRDEELRGLARSLHPSLAEIDLVGALNELARRFAGITDVTVDVDRELMRSPLPPGVPLTLYRACEEAVANAVKHGAARDVTVTLREDRPSGRILLVVTSEGSPGREDPSSLPADVEPGLGLTLIDTHVRTVGGTWDLRFDEGAGATLTVAIPTVERSGGHALPAAPPGDEHDRADDRDRDAQTPVRADEQVLRETDQLA